MTMFMTEATAKAELLTGPERRRRWAPAEKLAIVQETYALSIETKAPAPDDPALVLRMLAPATKRRLRRPGHPQRRGGPPPHQRTRAA